MPLAGQTISDVCEEALFLEEIARRHPNAPKPVVIGNCQGGWATMLLAAAGADGNNPIRYHGGLSAVALSIWCAKSLP